MAESVNAPFRTPGQDPIPSFLDALYAPEEDVRREVERYLTETPTQHTVPALCHVLRSDPRDDLRWAAAEALGIIGDPSAVPTLLASITDICPGVRLCVAEALGMVGEGDPRVAPALCCLLTDFDTGVRMCTLEALGDLGLPAALPALPALRTRLAAERRTPEVRVWVYYALDRLDDMPFPLTETIALLRCGSIRTRISAARVLSRVGESAKPETTLRICRALRAARAREKGEGPRECMERFLNEIAPPSPQN